MFTLFDMLAVGTIVVCLMISTSRGLVSELFDFFGWIVSLLVARMSAATVADSILTMMQPRQMAVMCAFVLVFITVRLFQHFLRFALNSAISKAKLTNINRMLGGVLGTLKGTLFVCLAVLMCSFSKLPQSDDWQNAATSEFFENLVKAGVPVLPDVFADQVHFPARELPDLPDPAPRSRRAPPVDKLTP